MKYSTFDVGVVGVNSRSGHGFVRTSSGCVFLLHRGITRGTASRSQFLRLTRVEVSSSGIMWKVKKRL